VSNTPRTGKNRVRFSTLCHPEDAWWVHETVSAQLEHELNAANERIKRLEEALESIREYWNRDNNERAMVDACWYAINTASEALDAKEAKP
jgi:hypothetical protein